MRMSNRHKRLMRAIRKYDRKIWLQCFDRTQLEQLMTKLLELGRIRCAS